MIEVMEHSKLMIYKKLGRDDYSRLTLEELLKKFEEFYKDESKSSFQFFKDGRNY